MKLRLWPRSLAARTAFVVLVGLVLVQIAGLTIHALDRMDIQRIAQSRNLGFRIIPIYRLIAVDRSGAARGGAGRATYSGWPQR